MHILFFIYLIIFFRAGPLFRVETKVDRNKNYFIFGPVQFQ